MLFYSLIYVSELVDVDDQQSLDVIREQAIELNQASGITGLLLHTPRHFCQLLQGPKPAVEETMARIQRDDRHRAPVVLLRTDFPDEMFPDWSMATTRVAAGETAEIVARMHNTRVAQPEDIDHIVAVMQQVRFGSSTAPGEVVSRSAQQRSLSAFNRTEFDDSVLDSYLRLGAALFQQRALLLLLRQPDGQHLLVKTSLTDLPAEWSRRLSGDAVAINQWCSENLPGDTSVVREYAFTELPQVLSELCSELGYGSAQAHLIRLGVSSDNRQLTIGEYFQAASLWLLSKGTVPKGLHDNIALFPAAAVDPKCSNYIGCLEHLLEQKRLEFEQGLLQRKAQRQQIAIAAGLERRNLVLNVASSAIVALDADYRVVMINQTARNLFNLHDQEVPFRWPDDIPFLDATARTELGAEAHPIQRAVVASGKQSEPLRVWFPLYDNHIVALTPHDNSRTLFLKCSAVAVTETDSAVAAVIVFDDITELERNRERIRRSDRLEALGHLTGGIAHDFNNLLATVLNSVELANVEHDPAERQSLLNLAIETVYRGTDLTNRLVAFAAAQPMKPEIHRVADILNAVQELARAGISSDVHLEIDQGPEALAVLCDSSQLENALLNLLINSRDAIVSSGIGGRVHIKVQRTTDIEGTKLVEISVVDDGPGMPEADILRATDPFFTTKDSTAGSGLGLSMVYRFIQQVNGELLIDNYAAAGGSGLRVRIHMDEALSGPAQTAPVPRIRTIQPGQSTILLVEDDTNLGRVLKKSIQHIGHQVLYFHSSDEAVRLLETDTQFDLLLTDVVMPASKLDGFKLAARVIEQRPGTRVVYMSGYVHRAAVDKPTLYGPVLSKPIGIGKLSTAIQQQLAGIAPALI